MDKQVMEHMTGVVDRHFHVAELNEFLKNCIQEKVQENSMWGEITLCIHFMLGGNSPLIYSIAAYTELIILALDMIDDLEDQDNVRKPWMQVSHAIALNAAVALLVAVVGEISKLKESHEVLSLPIVGEVNRFLTHAANGQHKDILKHHIETEDDYIQLILAKSSPLMVLACYMGYSSVEHCEPSKKLQINEMAQNLAIVAQLQNDVNDLVEFNVKSDLLDKKKTLPILYLLSQCSQRYPIFQNYYDGKVSQEQFMAMKEECVHHILGSGCVEYSKVIQGLYLNQVQNILKSVAGHAKWKRKLRDVAIAPYCI